MANHGGSLRYMQDPSQQGAGTLTQGVTNTSRIRFLQLSLKISKVPPFAHTALRQAESAEFRSGSFHTDCSGQQMQAQGCCLQLHPKELWFQTLAARTTRLSTPRCWGAGAAALGDVGRREFKRWHERLQKRRDDSEEEGGVIRDRGQQQMQTNKYQETEQKQKASQRLKSGNTRAVIGPAGYQL